MVERFELHLDTKEVISLPLIRGDENSFYSLNLLGQTFLNHELANLLAQKIQYEDKLPKFDTVITVESKAIALVQELCLIFGITKYIVLRKNKKSYMRNPISIPGNSITSGHCSYWIDEEDAQYLHGKTVIFCDDVISTGGTAKAAIQLLNSLNIVPIVLCCVATEGTPWSDFNGINVLSVGHIPLPRKISSGEDL